MFDLKLNQFQQFSSPKVVGRGSEMTNSNRCIKLRDLADRMVKSSEFFLPS